MLSIIRFFLGYILFCLKGRNSERFLNLVTRNGINIWNIKKTKDGKIFAKILASDYKTLKNYRRKCLVKVRIVKKFGNPFVIKKFKKRPGVIVGFFCFYLVLNLLSMFIWDVSVVGNNKLTEDEIIESVAEIGLDVGTRKEKLDTEILEKKAIAKIPSLSWISINVRGSSVKIEIQEKKPMPEVIPDDKFCNVIAKRSGQISRVEVYKGRAEVKNGDGISRGALLINGFEEDAFGKNSPCHASGKIFAITKHFLRERVNLSQYKETLTGEIINRRSVKFFGFKIPLTLNPRPGENYQKELNINKLKIGNSNLPIILYTERCYGQDRKKVKIDVDEAREKAEKNLKSREEFEFSDMKILKREKNERISNGIYYLDVLYNCEENVAKESKILNVN